MFLTRFSLRNRALIALVTVFIMLGGLIALGAMKRELIPSIQIPVAGVVTVVPGAGAGVIEDQVTTPVEAAVLGVEGVEKVESTSSAGFSSVTVNLEYGTDLPQAQAKLQRAVLAVRNLPEGAEPRVITGSIDDFPVLQLAASGPEDADRLAEQVRDLVVPELKDTPGVREVQVSGASAKVVRIDLDEDELKRTGITASTVTSLLQANGIVVPGGQIKDGTQDLSVEVGSRLTSLKQIRDLPLAAVPRGAGNPLSSLGGGGSLPSSGRTGTSSGSGSAPALGGVGMLAPVPQARPMAFTPTPTPTSPTPAPTPTDPGGPSTTTGPAPTDPTVTPTTPPTGGPTATPPTTPPTAIPTTTPPGWPDGVPSPEQLLRLVQDLPRLIAALDQLQQLQQQLSGLEKLQEQLKGLEQLGKLQGQLGELRKLQGQLDQLRGLQAQLAQLAQLQGQLQQLQGLQGQLAGLAQLQGQLSQLQALQGQLAGLSELQKQLAGLQGGQKVPTPTIHRLGDIAKVDLVDAAGAGISRSDGRNSVTLAITKVPSAGAVEVSQAIRDKLEATQAKIPGGRLTVVFDQAPYIEQSIEDLGVEGLLGLAMAVLVVFLFLWSVPLTVVTALSIPMSLLMGIIGMKTGGLSLNILTLGALTISVGRVVDDSIVVIENIKRHLDLGEPKNVAIPTAVKEVAAAITASTVSTIAVFLPIGVVGGQAGELFRPFAITVALAMSASLLVALTIIPVLGFWFVRADGGARRGARSLRKKRGARSQEKKHGPGLLLRGYLPALGLALRRPLVTVLAAFLLLALTGVAATGLKTDFIGDSGTDSLTVSQRLPAGTTLKTTDEKAAIVEGIMRRRPEVQSVQTTIAGSSAGGFESMFGGRGSNVARHTVTLKEDSDADAVSAALRQQFESRTDVGQVSVSAAGGGGPGSRQVEVSVQAANAEDLRTAAAAVEKAVGSVGGTRDVANNLAAATPALTVQVDRAKALQRGLTEPQIGLAVSKALQGSTIGKVELDEQRHDVVVHERETPRTESDLEDVPVGNDLNGKSVRLGAVATVERKNTAASISRVDGRRTALITATPEGNDLGALTRGIQSKLAATSLPPGASAEIGGVSAEQQEAFSQLGIALLIAVAVVYVVMVATFGSLIQPLILLVSIPLAATGALAALELTDTALGVPAIIGLLMLVGIVVTNAIVLIDLVNQHRERGASVRDAVYEGARDRVRPIVMTALATILALVPMAMSLSGGGAFISQPLALVVIGGLFSSTALTLLVVPALYVLIEARREGRGAPRDPFRDTDPAPSSDV